MSIRAKDAVTTQYRVDAGRTGFTTDTGPRWLDTLVWQRPLQGPVRGLVHDRGIVYAGAFGGVHAVNPATGADFWTFALPNVQFSPVAVVDDVVYVSGGNVFYALDRATGVAQWSVDTGAAIDKTSPLIDGRVAYVGSAAGTVHAIDLVTHAQLWSHSVGSPVRMHLAAAKNLLVVVTDAGLHALRMHDGDERWSKAGQWGPASATDKLVYAGANGGAFHALDLNTGNVEWTFAHAEHATGNWSASAHSGNVLVVTNTNGWVYTLNAGDGSRRLLMEEIDDLPANDPLIDANGRAYFGSGDNPAAPFGPVSIYVLNLETGLESERVIYGHVIGGAAVANGVMFVHDSTNTLAAYKD
jgi:outer membrane protein assembly factor BamB